MLRLPDLDQAKSTVLSSLSSIDAQREYRHAIKEFIEWYCSEPRLSFSKSVVLRYRRSSETAKSSTPVQVHYTLLKAERRILEIDSGANCARHSSSM
jgi:hypothetical protein